VANHKGEIFDLEGYAAVGMAGSSFVPLSTNNTIEMPYGGELMMLPDRWPVLYNIEKGRLEILHENPFEPGRPIFPVAAFNSPGYVISYVSAYQENESAEYLPLFSYGAAGWNNGVFRSAAILVDSERRQDIRMMKHEDVVNGIKKMQRTMPGNRLRKHLEKCALEYGCPAGKNFFLERFEAPLPVSQYCNARCMGCLSLQQKSKIPCSQNRIAFTPAPEEIAEIAITHIKRVNHSVVSFGQGCEGDPLMAADTIERAIRIIRSATSKGTINVNTNGSKPDEIKRLINAGLDSIRISINSFQNKCYTAYFRPVDYSFSDVKKSIDTALEKGKFISVNYLNCPGFTDTPKEMEALTRFMEEHPISMIQWRNLNFDPARYWKKMYSNSEQGMPIGVERMLSRIKQIFPDLKHGYFNPPKERFE
jgi:MoaA/NifB/PqqE/SkfB family radical SAM enzyme